MARSKKPQPDRCDGLEGGCYTYGDGTPCDDTEPTFEFCSAADSVKGDGYGYLGHFRQPKYLNAGHNDVDMTGKINDADGQNQYVTSTEQGVAPGSSASSVGQFASISGAGNPL